MMKYSKELAVIVYKITNRITNKFALELNPDGSRACAPSESEEPKTLGTARLSGTHRNTGYHAAAHIGTDSDSVGRWFESSRACQLFHRRTFERFFYGTV